MFLYGRDLFRMLNEVSELGCIGFLLLLLVFVAMLAAVGRVLGLVAPKNRRMEPGQVWLNLIPVFNIIWMPVTVERVGESIRNEMVARGRDRQGDGYGKTTGLTGLVLLATGILPLVPVVTWPVAMVYGIVYWIQIVGYGRRIRNSADDFWTTDEGW